MALFQRQPIILRQDLPYTISISRVTMLIVGLGNPGKKYALTRHNTGFMALDNFAVSNEFEPFYKADKFKGEITEKVVGSTRVILLKPHTFMNLSGQAARTVAAFYKVAPQNILAVYDELSIPFGQIRSRNGGSSAGHNGVDSLITELGPDFGRLRIGIKNTLAKDIDATDFVLQKFEDKEQKKLPNIFSEAHAMLTEFIFSGQIKEETRKVV